MNSSFPSFQAGHKHLLPTLLCALFLFVACRSAADSEKTPDQTPHFLIIDTFRVPVLSTPLDQLTYALTTILEIEEKAAALRAIKIMHPTAGKIVALADLELAYLQLGTDYRLADTRQCTMAKEKYLAILSDYADYPEVAAKSLWYLGWITCDLLHQKVEGLEFYRKIVDNHPNEIVNFSTPAPWLTIFPANIRTGSPPSAPRPVLSWAAMAHLEILRNSANSEEALRSFSAITEKHGRDTFTGLALKALLIAHGSTGDVAPQVRKYLGDNTADKTLNDDLFLVLTGHLRDSPAEAGRQ